MSALDDAAKKMVWHPYGDKFWVSPNVPLLTYAVDGELAPSGRMEMLRRLAAEIGNECDLAQCILDDDALLIWVNGSLRWVK